MPSAVTSMVAPGLETVIAPEKPNARKKITALVLDNVLGGVPHTITIQDRFTPSTSNLVPGPPGVSVIPRFRARITNGPGLVWNFDEIELKNVEVLGQLELAIDAADAFTFVTIAWEHD